MPSKASQHLAFYFVLLLSVGLHRYVYGNFKRILLRDFPKAGVMLVRIALVLFIAMDVPFAFVYFRGEIHGEYTMLTRVLLYPFSLWQALMFMWALILVPFSLWRRRERLGVAWARERFARVRGYTEDIPVEEIVGEGEIALEGAVE